MDMASTWVFSGVSFHLEACPQGVARVLFKKTPTFGSPMLKVRPPDGNQQSCKDTLTNLHEFVVVPVSVVHAVVLHLPLLLEPVSRHVLVLKLLLLMVLLWVVVVRMRPLFLLVRTSHDGRRRGRRRRRGDRGRPGRKVTAAANVRRGRRGPVGARDAVDRGRAVARPNDGRSRRGGGGRRAAVARGGRVAVGAHGGGGDGHEREGAQLCLEHGLTALALAGGGNDACVGLGRRRVAEPVRVGRSQKICNNGEKKR